MRWNEYSWRVRGGVKIELGSREPWRCGMKSLTPQLSAWTCSRLIACVQKGLNHELMTQGQCLPSLQRADDRPCENGSKPVSSMLHTAQWLEARARKARETQCNLWFQHGVGCRRQAGFEPSIHRTQPVIGVLMLPVSQTYRQLDRNHIFSVRLN